MSKDEILSDLEFEQRIGELSDRGLQEFTARQVYETRKDVSSNTKRIFALEGKNKKVFAITGGAGSLFGAAIIAVINYFANK